MKSFLVLLLITLAGCSTPVPVKQKFPPAPQSAQQPCPGLVPVPDNAQLSEIGKTVNQNYQQYWQCALKVDAWQEWYRTQKSIFEEVK